MTDKPSFDYQRQAERFVLSIMVEAARIQIKLNAGDKEGADAIYKACVHQVDARLRELKDELN